MKPFYKMRAYVCGALMLVGASGVSTAMAETPAGSVAESRVLVGLKVTPDAIGAMMPDGWISIPFPAGPLKGSNAMIGFLDGHAVIDTEGKSIGTRSTAAVMALAKPSQSEDVRLFVLRVYTDDPEANPYGNTNAAAITRTRTQQSGADGRSHSETWTVVPQSGGEIAFSLTYTMGVPGWSTGSSKSFSAEDTDFAVSQTYQQLADLALSTGLGKPLAGDVSLSSTVEGLSGLFDGAQEISAVVNIPMYIREVSLP